MLYSCPSKEIGRASLFLPLHFPAQTSGVTDLPHAAPTAP